MYKYMLLLCGTLIISGCGFLINNGKGNTDPCAEMTQAAAQACISVATDPDEPVMGSYDVKRLTNTCECDINLAFSSTDGRPLPDAPELPHLSPNEWTRAYITQGSNGQVGYYACPAPQTVDISDWSTDGTASCVSP